MWHNSKSARQQSQSKQVRTLVMHLCSLSDKYTWENYRFVCLDFMAYQPSLVI